MSMKEEIRRQMVGWDHAKGDRIDPVAQLCRRLYLRTEVCPCGGVDDGYKHLCIQCVNDHLAIEEAWSTR